MQPVKISVIVPVFNVEKYLPRCIDSITSQTFKEWEIVLIDDSSGDGCQDLCRQYAESDPRIKVFRNKVNLGIGKVRNQGLDYSKGEYLFFVDSDDYLLTDSVLEKMYKKASQFDLDIVDSGYRIIKSQQQTEHPKGFAKVPDEVMNGKEYLDKIPVFSVTIWNRLYKKEMITQQKIRFPERNYEDVSFALETFSRAERVMALRDITYAYCIREDSVMTSKVTMQSLKDALALCYDLERLYMESGKNSQIEKSFFYSFIGLKRLLNRYSYNEAGKNSIKKGLKKLYNGYRISILKAKKLSLPLRVMLVISPSLANYVLSRFNK